MRPCNATCTLVRSYLQELSKKEEISIEKSRPPQAAGWFVRTPRTPPHGTGLSLINDSISCITCVIVYSPVHTLIFILLIYSVTDALNVYMYVMYLVFETFHMQELYPTTLDMLHSSELSRGGEIVPKGGKCPPPPLNEALHAIMKSP